MVAVYPGSFDPVTSGHFDVITRAAALFDRVIVLVAVNSSKTPLFSAGERKTMLEECCAELSNVHIDILDKRLLVEYARQNGAQAIVKGLRAVSDFEYEFQMALLNRRLQPDVETVFLMTSAEYSYLSSSIVKEIGRLGGDVRGLVPDIALAYLRAKFSQGPAAA